MKGVKIGLAGPILVGDGPWSFRYTQRQHQIKAQLFDLYRSYNQKISLDLNLTYIDLRQAYLDAVPSYHKGFRHCVTVDGNHPSENGAYINAYKISQTLLEWFGPGMQASRQSKSNVKYYDDSMTHQSIHLKDMNE